MPVNGNTFLLLWLRVKVWAHVIRSWAGFEVCCCYLRSSLVPHRPIIPCVRVEGQMPVCSFSDDCSILALKCVLCILPQRKSASCNSPCVLDGWGCSGSGGRPLWFWWSLSPTLTLDPWISGGQITQWPCLSCRDPAPPCTRGPESNL